MCPELTRVFFRRFSKDIYTIDETLPRAFLQYVRTSTQVISVIAVIVYATPFFLAFVLPIGGAYYIVQKRFIAVSRELRRLESISRSPIFTHFGETLTGASVIRAFSQTRQFTARNLELLDANQRAYYPSLAINRWLAYRLESIGSAIIFCAALFAVISRDYFNLAASTFYTQYMCACGGGHLMSLCFGRFGWIVRVVCAQRHADAQLAHSDVQ